MGGNKRSTEKCLQKRENYRTEKLYKTKDRKGKRARKGIRNLL